MPRQRHTRRLGAAILLAACCGSCSSGTFSHEVQLAEFDSISQRKANGAEPLRLEYLRDPERLPWFVRQFGWGRDLFGEAVPVPQDNPSGFARETLEDLVDDVNDDLMRSAQLLARFLWVLQADENTLNRLVALEGVERICAELRLSLLASDVQEVDVSPQRRQAIDDADKTIKEYGPALRSKRLLTTKTRKLLIDAIRTEVARPLPSALARRRQVLRLHGLAAFETDPAALQAMRKALLRAVHITASFGLRDALRSDRPQVRIAALRAMRRRGGAAGLAYALYWKVRFQALGRGNPYDQDPDVRLMLVRLCGQLHLADAERSYAGGKTPLDCLFETGVNESEPANLRHAALEGLGRCLGRKRNSVDPTWARQWRKEYLSKRARP